MPSKRRKAVGVVELPKGVHRVVSRGREYFYWQPGRGTSAPAERVAIRPNDPSDPAFWAELRRLQGLAGTTVILFGAVCDLYETSEHFLKRLTPGSQRMYRRQLSVARAGLGHRPAEQIGPHLIAGIVDGLGDTPGAANNFLGCMRALSSWGVVRRYFPHSITEGVKPYAARGGHKPWTAEQLAAGTKLTGLVRQAWFLARYTGQRGSDVLRVGETFLHEGGFRLTQKKTGREVWIPVDDALAAEMATWPRAPGPYVRHPDGRAVTRQQLHDGFREQREAIPELAGVTFHGLRGTRVVELRMFGLTPLQIQDQVGMSLAMIERYCRFADKMLSGKASVVALAERRRNKNL